MEFLLISPFLSLVAGNQQNGRGFITLGNGTGVFNTKRLHDMESEPLANIPVEWIQQSQDYLFPAYRKSKRPFLAPSTAILRTVEANFKDLVDEGVISLPKVRLYDHWFRTMRASQLVKDYRYDEFRLKPYFGWVDSTMPYHYAHLGWKS